MKSVLNYSTYKITVAPGKPVKQNVVCTYVRCLESDGAVMMSVNGARPRIWRTGQWIESPATSYVTSAGNIPDDLVIRTLEFAALDNATGPVTLLIATSTGRDGDDSLSVVNEIPVVARAPLPVVTHQVLCPAPPADPNLHFDETWGNQSFPINEYLQCQGTRGRCWLAATWKNVHVYGDSPTPVLLPPGCEVVLLAGFDRMVIIAAVPLIAQRYKMPVRRIALIGLGVIAALYLLTGCNLKPLKTPPYPDGVYPRLSSEAYAAAKAKSLSRIDAAQAATPYAPPTAIEAARARSYGQWQIAAIGFVALAVILFVSKYPLAALCFLGGGVFCGFFGNAFTSATIATVMVATGIGGAVFFLAWQLITRAIPFLRQKFPPASAQRA